jgi:hypothetical protein
MSDDPPEISSNWIQIRDIGSHQSLKMGDAPKSFMAQIQPTESAAHFQLAKGEWLQERVDASR